MVTVKLGKFPLSRYLPCEYQFYVNASHSLVKHHTFTVPVPTQDQNSQVPVNYQGRVTKCWGEKGGVALQLMGDYILYHLVASCYGNQYKLQVDEPVGSGTNSTVTLPNYSYYLNHNHSSHEDNIL